MIKKDFPFFMILVISILVLLLDLIFIGLGIWKIIELSTFDILNLDMTRPYAISMMVINGMYVIYLALYLVFRKAK